MQEYSELERVAGVEYQRGRGWYGVRRRFTDLHADTMAKVLRYADSRILDSITGHIPQDLRQGMYQDRWRVEVLLPAAQVRESTLAALLAETPSTLTQATKVAPRLSHDYGTWEKKKRRADAVARKTALLAKHLRLLAKPAAKRS